MIVKGAIIRVNFFSKVNGYTVALFALDYESFRENEDKLTKSSLPIIGNFDREPQNDEEYELTGEFIKDKKYGIEFKFTSFKRAEINDEFSLINYLSSSIFEGIGKITASKIVDKLGLKAIEKIKTDKNVLEGIGLTRKQINIIRDGLIKDQINQEAILFYLSGGLTIDVASKIINTLGSNNLRMVKENPYILMEKIERIGFKKNDAFALNIGIKRNSPERLKALITFLLKELIYNNGNSYVYLSELLNQVNKYYSGEAEMLDQTELMKMITELKESKKLVLQKDDIQKDYLIFDYVLYHQEITTALFVASMIKKKRGKTKEFPISLVQETYQQVITELNIKLSVKQEEAIKKAFSNDIMIITGGPGTGKTTIVKTIIDIYEKLFIKKQTALDNIALIAPTGRASKRLYETSGCNASTIHRYLGYDGQHFAYNKDEPRNEELVIVDEASMMDLPLFYQLITAINPNARLIIVGDVDQLPSIGPGQILKDLIDTKEITVIKLDQIHRQASNSSIITLAHAINDGIIPETLLEKKADRSFIYSTSETILKNLLDIVKISISKGFDIQKDIQILIPMYKGVVGIDNVNNSLQELLNPKKNIKFYEYHALNKKFRINDKVIQLINRPEKGVMNGDIGIIESFIVLEDVITGLTANFDGKKVDYLIEEFDDLSLAYAITIHKSQGSEFKVVILPISSQHYVMLKRKLLYTAITRAKSKLILLGEPQIFAIGVKQVENNRRTILKEEIIKNLQDGIVQDKQCNVLTDETEIFHYDVPLSFEEELTPFDDIEIPEIVDGDLIRDDQIMDFPHFEKSSTEEDNSTIGEREFDESFDLDDLTTK